MSKQVVTSNGIGFFGLLTIVLIVLKLTNTIQIGWGGIALIFFAPLIFILVFIIIALIVALIINCIK